MNQDRQKEQFGYRRAEENPNAIAKRHAAFREAEAIRIISQLAGEIKSGQDTHNISNSTETITKAIDTSRKPEEAILTIAVKGSIEDSRTWFQTTRERIEKLGRAA